MRRTAGSARVSRLYVLMTMIRPLFLVLGNGFNFQQGKFLELDKMFVPIASFIAINS